MLLSCQDVLERLQMVLKTVEQIVLYVSSVLVHRPSLFVVYLSSVLVNCSTTATVCIGQVSPCQWQTIRHATVLRRLIAVAEQQSLNLQPEEKRLLLLVNLHM